MIYETLRYELNEGIAQLTLNRPEALNALNVAMRAELTHALRAAAKVARVVVMTGAGRAFCAGQDLGDAQALARVDLERMLRDEYTPLILAIADCPVPVLAAVNGTAAGAGCSLALAADVVVAAESASFLQAFSRVGLAPDAGGSWTLPRRVGTARAMGMALFSEPISARQAADWGMIWEAVPDRSFEAQWQARARHLAHGPTLAYRATRQALRDSALNDLETQLLLEARLQGACGQSRDFREGVVAFGEKRAPRFEGR